MTKCNQEFYPPIVNGAICRLLKKSISLDIMKSSGVNSGCTLNCYPVLIVLCNYNLCYSYRPVCEQWLWPGWRQAMADNRTQHGRCGTQLSYSLLPHALGKSTFLRQNALMAILAQVCIVVKYCSIPGAYLGGFPGALESPNTAMGATTDHHSGIYTHMKQQTILCLAAQMHAQWMGTE